MSRVKLLYNLALIVIFSSGLSSLHAQPLAKSSKKVGSKSSSVQPLLLKKKGKLVAQNNTLQSQSASTQSLSTTGSGTSVATLPPPAAAESESKFRLDLGLSRSSTQYKDNSLDRTASTDLDINPSYRFNKRWSMSALASVSKEETGAKNTTLSNTVIGVNMKSMMWSDKTMLSHTLAGIAPTDKDMREQDKFQGAVRLGNRISTELLSVGLSYELRLTRNFHEFTQNADGEFNTQYGLSHIVAATIPLFIEELSVTTTGRYGQSRTYRNDDKYGFFFDAELDYSLTKKLTLLAGLTNEGPALKANGTDSNIKLYDENTSSIRAGLSYQF